MIHNDARWIFFNENWREKIFNHRFFVCSQQCSLPRIYVPFHLAESSQTFSRNTLEFRYSRGEKDCVIRTANNSGRQLLHAEQKGYDVYKRKLFPVKLNRIRSLNGDRTIFIYDFSFPHQILPTRFSTLNLISRNEKRIEETRNPWKIILVIEKRVKNDFLTIF